MVSFSDIEEMRQLIETKYLYGCYRINEPEIYSRSYDPKEKIIFVEEQLRTHILAGHKPSDFVD